MIPRYSRPQMVDIWQPEEALEEAQAAGQSRLHEVHRRQADLGSRLSAKHTEMGQLRSRGEQIQRELDEAGEQRMSDERDLREARQRLEQTLGLMADHARERESLTAQREARRIAVDATRQSWHEARNRAHQIALTVETLRTRKEALAQADLVVLAGTTLDFRMKFGRSIPAEAKIVQLDLDETLIGQNRPANVGLVGNLGANLDALADVLLKADTQPSFAEWSAELRAGEELAEEALAAQLTSDEVPIERKTSQWIAAEQASSRARSGMASPNQTTPGRRWPPQSGQTGTSIL